jgi:hypothetical protein
VNLVRGNLLFSIDVKRCRAHLIKRGMRAPASIRGNGLSCSTETEKYTNQIADPVSPQTSSSPAQPPSGLSGSNTSQVKTDLDLGERDSLWIIGLLVDFFSSGQSGRIGSGHSGRAAPNDDARRGNESIGTCSGSETSRIDDFTAGQKSRISEAANQEKPPREQGRHGRQLK